MAIMFQFLKIFKKLKAASRLKKLWLNYTKVAGLEGEAKSEKLLEFLRILEQEIQRMSPRDLQHIFQNFQEFMEVIREVITQSALAGPRSELSAFLNSILVTAEKAVNNPTYREAFQKSAGLVKAVAELLEKAQNHETKSLVVRIIKIFSESAENQQILGQVEAYRKVFQLIRDPDPAIRREIMQFLTHFVDISDIQDQRPQQRLLQKVFQLFKGVLTNFNDRLEEGDEEKPPASSESLSTEQLSGVFAFSTGLQTQEYPPTASALRSWEGELVARWRSLANFNFAEVETASFDFPEMEVAHTQEKVSCARLLFGSGAELEESKSPSKKKGGGAGGGSAASKRSDVMDLFRLQGVLKEIISALGEEDSSSLELMKITAKLLNQPQNQEEFKARGGYSAVNLFFHRDYSQPNQQKFLASALNILEKIIFNSPSTETGLVQNLEGLKVLLKLLLEGTNLALLLKAIQTLRRVLQMHPYNALVLLKLRQGFQQVWVSLVRVLVEDEKRRAELIEELIPSVSAGAACFQQVESLQKGTARGLSGKQKLEYFKEVDELLSFTASLLNDSANATPLRLYGLLIRRAAKHLPTDILQLLLESSLRLVNDKLQRGARLERSSFALQQLQPVVDDVAMRFMKEATAQNQNQVFLQTYAILAKLLAVKALVQPEHEPQAAGSPVQEKLAAMVAGLLEQGPDPRSFQLAELLGLVGGEAALGILLPTLFKFVHTGRCPEASFSALEKVCKNSRGAQDWLIGGSQELHNMSKQLEEENISAEQLLRFAHLLYLATFNNQKAKAQLQTGILSVPTFYAAIVRFIPEISEDALRTVVDQLFELASGQAGPINEQYPWAPLREERESLADCSFALGKLPLRKQSIRLTAMSEEQPSWEGTQKQAVRPLRQSAWLHAILLLGRSAPERLGVYIVERFVEMLQIDANRERMMLLEAHQLLLQAYQTSCASAGEHLSIGLAQLICEVLRQGVSRPPELNLMLEDIRLQSEFAQILQTNRPDYYYQVAPGGSYASVGVPALPGKKPGFTIVTWVELSERNKINPILSLHSQREDLLELIYQYNEPQKAQKRSSLQSLNEQEVKRLQESPVYVLEARIRQNKPMKYTLSEEDLRPGVYAHIALIVTKTTRSLWINGREFKQESSETEAAASADFIYPFPKEKPLKLILEPDQRKSFAGLGIFQGALVPAQLAKIFQTGPSEVPEVDAKTLFRLPRRKWMPLVPAKLNSPPHQPAVLSAVRQAELSAEPPKRTSLGAESPGSIECGSPALEAYSTFTAKQWLTAPGPMKEVVSSLLLREEVCLADKLYFLRGLFFQNREAYALFLDMKGLQLLSWLVSRACEERAMDERTLGYLLDLLCDDLDAHRRLVVTVTRLPPERISLIRRRGVLALILDSLFWLRECEKFGKAADCLFVLLGQPQNREVLRELGGVRRLLGLLKHVSCVAYDDEQHYMLQVHHKLIKIVEAYIARFPVLREEAEMDFFLSFLVAGGVHQPKFKQAVVDLLGILGAHLLCSEPYFQQKLLHFDLLHFTTALIAQDRREITLFALKILACFLHADSRQGKRFRAQYYKNGRGPEILELALAASDPQRLRSVVNILPQLALEQALHPSLFYPEQTKDHISQILYESLGQEIGKRSEPGRVKLPDFLKMYFHLLPGVPAGAFLVQYKAHISVLDSPATMGSLLESERYFAMVYECLAEVRGLLDEQAGARVEAELVAYLTDVARADLGQPGGSGRLAKQLKQIACEAHFYETLLSHLNEDLLLRDSEADPSKFLKNYSQFFFTFEFAASSPLTLLSALKFIRNLPESVQRKQLIKEHKLPALRDTFILALFRMSVREDLLPPDYFMNALSIVASYKSITQEAAKQKEPLWQLYLIRFLGAVKDKAFQLQVLSRLRQDIWTIDENRKALISFFKSPEITDLLLGGGSSSSEQAEGWAESALGLLCGEMVVEKVEKKTAQMAAKFLQGLDEIKNKKKVAAKEAALQRGEKQAAARKTYALFEMQGARFGGERKEGVQSELAKLESARRERVGKKTAQMAAKFLQGLDEIKNKKKVAAKEAALQRGEKQAAARKTYALFEMQGARFGGERKEGVQSELAKLESSRRERVGEGEKEAQAY